MLPGRLLKIHPGGYALRDGFQGCLVDGLGHGFIIPIHEGYAERFPGEDMYHYLLQQIHSMPPWNSLSDLN